MKQIRHLKKHVLDGLTIFVQNCTFSSKLLWWVGGFRTNIKCRKKFPSQSILKHKFPISNQKACFKKFALWVSSFSPINGLFTVSFLSRIDGNSLISSILEMLTHLQKEHPLITLVLYQSIEF